jgi:hypothetical protein
LAINVFKTIFGEKGAKKVQHELQALRVCEYSWFKSHPLKSIETIMPTTLSWVIPKEKGFAFPGKHGQSQITKWVCIKLQKHVVKGKLGAMKSHDYHVLFQQILQLCMGN